jgi:dTDP-4-dehydrorhamnose reductase
LCPLVKIAAQRLRHEGDEINMETVVIFGGTGFIGTHLSQFLLCDSAVQEIVLADLNPPRSESYTTALQDALASGRVRYLNCDVRQSLHLDAFPHADTIFNLAAIHREPGHLASEYYETNLAGAEHVCAYATAAGCTRIVFTSSISPYGPTESRKDEASIPLPETPYGGSKLVAEKIHLVWQASKADRKLLIVRPGVVFGPGEGGNVTRLVRSIVRGYFLYMGNFRRTIQNYNLRHCCQVGITGWAQVNGLRGDTSIPDRLQYDLYYIRNWSFGLDLQIIARTMFTAPRDGLHDPDDRHHQRYRSESGSQPIWSGSVFASEPICSTESLSGIPTCVAPVSSLLPDVPTPSPPGSSGEVYSVDSSDDRRALQMRA